MQVNQNFGLKQKRFCGIREEKGRHEY